MSLYEYRESPVFDRLPKRKRFLKYYLVGVVDAEGCFSVSLKQQKDARFGYVLDPVFSVSQHESNKAVLDLLRRELDCGRVIRKHGQASCWVFTVDNRRQLIEKVIPFFRRYKLLLKWDDFVKFSRIVSGLEAREHWKKDSFKALVKLAFSMNLLGKQRRKNLDTVLKRIG